LLLAWDKRLKILASIVVIVFVPLGALGGMGLIDLSPIRENLTTELTQQNYTQEPEIETAPEPVPLEEPFPESAPSEIKQLPIAKIFGPASAKRGSMVSFTSEFSHDPDGGKIVKSKWIFDDGREFTGQVIEFRVMQSLKHTIMLIVTDDEGQIGFDRFFIDVVPKI